MGYDSHMVSGEGTMRTTTSHETGHAFGLCDEAYGGGYCPDSGCPSGYCSSSESGLDCVPGSECCPNKPEQNSIMCADSRSCGGRCLNGEQFAPTSYAHLEKELNKYCVK